MSAPVSVIIPAFNRRDSILRAIASVRAQILQPSEVLVIDDCSNDDTAELAEAAGVTVIRLAKNGGAARARNEGVRAAGQPWIAFLDSDDEWLPHHLSALWPYTHQSSFISGSRTSAQNAIGRPSRLVRGGQARHLSNPVELIFPDNPVSIGATLVLKEAIEDAGGFDERLRISEDLDLWIRVVRKYPALLVREPVYAYHRHAGQKTSSVETTRAAQLALLERYRSEAWWDERAFRRRRSLNHAEILITAGEKKRAARFVLRGVLEDPSTYLRIARVLAENSLRARRGDY